MTVFHNLCRDYHEITAQKSKNKKQNEKQKKGEGRERRWEKEAN